MCGLGRATPAVLLLCLVALCGCETLKVQDTQSLLSSRFTRSEIVGLVAGFGTTFAALPDLLAILRRRSAEGMHPRMAAIMAVFQMLWIYYGLLIAARPVIVWNVLAVIINTANVAAWAYYAARKSKAGPP
jgi:MtN3 and saliva related transmembrane protein